MHEDEPTLLKHFQDIRTNSIPEGGLTTIIFCGKIRSENDLLSALQTHRSIVEKEVNEEEANVTGILIGQANTILHLLEGPCFSVLRILSHLAGHVDFFGPSPLQAGTIVYSVEDRPKRYFPEWYSTTITTAQDKKASVEDITADNCLDVVFETASKLLEIGNGLESNELELSRFADQLPGKNLILAMATSTCFFSLEDYVKFFQDPYHIDLESERTWPLERIVEF